MKSWVKSLPFFEERELACRCCGKLKLDIRFAAMLPFLRQKWGKPLIINSCCRCSSHNIRVKGHPTSLHLTENDKWRTGGASAADINWKDWPVSEKVAFARMAHAMGFRLGLHDGFCHIDIGRLLGTTPKPFVYGQWSMEFDVEDVL